MRSTQWLPLLTLLLTGGPALAEDMAAIAASRAALVPVGWQIEAEASGDLDADGRPDLALVLAGAGIDLSEGAEELVGPRRLVIAFGAEAGYERIIANSQFIPPSDNPDIVDMFDASSEGLRITEGDLVLDLNLFSMIGGWDMWTKSYTFRWQDGGAFVLTRFDWYNTHRSSGVTTFTSADYATHTIEITHGNIANEIQTTQTARLPPGAMIALDDIVDGMAFEP